MTNDKSQKKPPLKVLIILPDLGAGGAQVMNIRLAEQLALRGWDVRVVILFKRPITISKSRLQPINLQYLGANSFASKVALIPQLARHARAADVVIAGMELAATNYGFIVTQLTRKPLLSWTHIAFDNYMHAQSAIDRWISFAIYRKLKHIVFPSAGAKTSLENALKSQPPNANWHVIYNFMDSFPSTSCQRFLNCERAFSRPAILIIARLTEQKAIHRIILAHKHLLLKRIDHHLIIFGDGPLRCKLKDQVMSLGVNNTVFMPGHIVDAHAWISHASVFALCSDYEGFSLVILEALQYGTPVVSMDCPAGPGEILNDGEFGILTPAGDQDKFEEGLQKILTDNEVREYYAKKGSERASYFSADHIVSRWEKLLRSTIDLTQ